MQKKILASLLVTPLAFNAMANITIVPDLVGGGEGWSQDGGVTGSDPIFNGTGLSCPLTGGVLTTTVAKKLNPGNYKIEFTNPDNIKVEVKAGDTVLGSTLTDGAVAFEVTATGTEITVSVQSADQINGFGFEKAGLVLDVNFAEIQTALNENLAAVLPVEIAPEDDRAEAEALRNTYAELKGRYDALAAAVAELNTESIGIYNKYQLWADPNVIQQGIDQIKTSVEEYNEAAEAENAVWEVSRPTAKPRPLSRLQSRTSRLILPLRRPLSTPPRLRQCPQPCRMPTMPIWLPLMKLIPRPQQLSRHSRPLLSRHTPTRPRKISSAKIRPRPFNC